VVLDTLEDDPRELEEVAGSSPPLADRGGSGKAKAPESVSSQTMTTKGDVLNSLAFFFDMPQMASASTPLHSMASLLTVSKQALSQLLVNFQEEEQIMAENCLAEYDTMKERRALSVAGSRNSKRSSSSKAPSSTHSVAQGHKNTFDDKIRVLRRKRTTTLMMRCVRRLCIAPASSARRLPSPSGCDYIHLRIGTRYHHTTRLR
jgi:hypothetical protein